MAEQDEKSTLAVSLKKRILSVPTLLSFVIATAFMVFLATQFNLDWAATWRNVREMNPWLYMAGFASYYLSFFFRGMRWRILARNAESTDANEKSLPSALASAQLIVIGWFVNSIAWLRMGDAYRAYAYSEESDRSFSWSLGTVFSERVIDMVVILVILVISVIALALTTHSLGTSYLLVAAFAMALVLVLSLVGMRLYGAKLAGRLPEKFEAAYHRFHQGTLGSLKQLPLLMTLGVIGWLLEIARLYFVVQALNMDAIWPIIAIVALGHAILSTVPTPGGVGAVEPGVTGLLLLSFARHDAVSIALVDRSITYLSVILVGGVIFFAWQITRSRRNHHRKPADDERIQRQHGIAD